MKNILIFVIILVLNNSVYSQDNVQRVATPSPAVQFGLKGGLNIADLKNIKGSFIPSIDDNRIGYHAGILMHIHINNFLAVQPEVVFSSQGAKTAENKYVTNYINVPVLAQYMISGFRIQTGPQIGFLVGAHTEDNAGNQNKALKSFLKTTDFSWSFGAGYLTPVGLGVDARYNYGITNVRNDPAQDVKHRVWQLGLFYQFGVTR